MGEIQKLISSRKRTLSILSTPYFIRDWVDGNTKDLKDIKKAQKENDLTDIEMLECFK